MKLVKLLWLFPQEKEERCTGCCICCRLPQQKKTEHVFLDFLFLIRPQEAASLLLLRLFTINEEGKAQSHVHSVAVLGRLQPPLYPLSALQRAVDDTQSSSCLCCPCLCSLTTQALWHFAHNSRVNWTSKWPYSVRTKQRHAVMVSLFSGQCAMVVAPLMDQAALSEGRHYFFCIQYLFN